MSPLLRDEVTIGFAPGRVELVRRARGWRSRVACAAPIAFRHRGEGGWGAGIATLQKALADARWQRARCRLVLSNQYARFALIDTPAGLADEEERAAYVELRFRKTYGERADTWEITFTPIGDGKCMLACGIDRALLNALRDCAARARLDLVSLQPYLITSFNRVAAKLPGGNAWFMTVENGRIAMAAFHQDRWECVRSEPLTGDVGEAVAGMLLQDSLSRELSADERCAYVNAPGWSGRLVAPGPGWSMKRVETLAQGDERALDPAAFPLTAPGFGLA